MSELTNWLKIIEKSPKTGWPAFYQASVGHPVSNTETLFWCIEAYGKWPTFEAILAAKKKKDLVDALPYVLAVAQAKWKDFQVQLSEDRQYDRGLRRAKRRTAEQNQELEDKLRKAKAGG